MNKPTVTINGTVHEIKTLKARDWKFLAEFMDADIEPSQPDFVERHCEFIAHFFDGVTVDDILDLPICDIMPLYTDIQKFFTASMYEKLDAATKKTDAELKKIMEESK